MNLRVCRVAVYHVSSKVMALTKANSAHSVPKSKHQANSYILSYQAERFHQGKRYYWMICGSQNPDQLISWGHAATQEEAEKAARDEVSDLSSGLTQGGRVTTTKPFTRR